MKFSTLSKAGFAASLCAALTGWSTGVQAGTLQDTIFAKVEPSVRDRMFFRLSYIVANVKTTAKDAYDVTGPVLARNDLTNYLGDGSGFDSMFTTGGEAPNYDFVQGVLDTFAFNANSNCATIRSGLGTPCGIKARSNARLATAGMSVGYYLDEEQDWTLEAYLLAAPLKASVYGDGRNGLNGKKIIETKFLPPLVMLTYAFGGKSDLFRPYAGLLGSYGIFYDTKATNDLNVYQGGGSPGDTTVSIRNTFGFGPVVGLKIQPSQSAWRMIFTLGKARYKTDATLVTRNTVISQDSQVLKDFGPTVDQAIIKGNNSFTGTNIMTVINDNSPVGYKAGDTLPLTTAMMCDLAKAKNNGNTSCNQGTYVRKAANTLDSTLMVFSVEHSF